MLVGTRVLLGPLARDDSAQMFEWINDRSQVVLSAPYRPVSQVTHEHWFETIQQRPDVSIFAIRTITDNTLIGSCQLHSISTVHRRAELQIRIGEVDYQRKGLGSEALQLLLGFGFHDLNLERVQLHVLPGNHRAITLYEKLGFVREGTLRKAVFVDGRYQDLFVMGVLRDEYEQK